MLKLSIVSYRVV